MEIDANTAKRATSRKETAVARSRYQNGSLRTRGKRSKVWVARWREDVLLPNGKLSRVRRAEVLGPVAQLSKREALNLLAAKLRPFNLGQHKPQSSLTLEQFIRQEWEVNMAPLLKPTSARYYGIQLRCHIIPQLGSRRLCDFTRAEAQAFLTAKRKQGLSGSSVHGIRTALSKVLQAAVDWDYLSSNPARGLLVGDRNPRKETVYLSPDQIRLLASSLAEPCRTIVLLLALTGLRIGELLALRRKHLDFSNGVIRVRETVYEGRFGAPKTRSSRRDVPMSGAARELLQGARRTGGDQDLVFASRAGTPINPKNLASRELRPACRRLKLPTVGWHSFRHTHGTLLTEVGESIKTTQAILGHSDLETTLNIYSHAIPESQRRAIERVSEILDSNGLKNEAPFANRGKLTVC
jgi:integrase